MEDTSRRDPLLHVLGSDSDRGLGGYVIEQETAGTRQLLASDLLPTDLGGKLEEFVSLGFEFGAVVDDDPLFCHARLPHGWTRKASDADRLFYLVDEHGRQRVHVHYKAAFHDRDARATLISLDWYVTTVVEYDTPLVLDDSWATRDEVIRICRSRAASHREEHRTAKAELFDAYADKLAATGNSPASSAPAAHWFVKNQLPVDMNGGDERLIDFGVVLGDPVGTDALFRTVTLPDGWVHESVGAQLSYLVDPLGRRRVRVYYHPEEGDEDCEYAEGRILTLSDYLDSVAAGDDPLIIDGVWATTENVITTSRQLASRYRVDGHEPEARQCDDLADRVAGGGR